MLTTDGSSQSAVAVELVARWPIFDLTRIHVVTVSSDAPPARAPGSGSPSAEDQRTVDAVAGMLMDAGRDVVSEVLHGRPGARIAEEARAQAVDLIVIGSRGRTGLGRTLLGSVAGDLLASASCSVLIVAPPPRRP
jgi:nucleotide-binding universal stress UspA family protein